MAKHNHYRDTGFARGKMTTYYLPLGLREEIIEVAKRELAKGVIRIVADAKSRCPVDTGELRHSIKAESNEDETFFYISANAYKRTTSLKSVTGKFYYGQMVEFSPKINKPFLYPAIQAHIEEISNNMKNVILTTVSGRSSNRRVA